MSSDLVNHIETSLKINFITWLPHLVTRWKAFRILVSMSLSPYCTGTKFGALGGLFDERIFISLPRPQKSFSSGKTWLQTKWGITLLYKIKWSGGLSLIPWLALMIYHIYMYLLSLANSLNAFPSTLAPVLFTIESTWSFNLTVTFYENFRPFWQRC